MNDAYLLDCWYMAAWDDEIPTDGLLARTLLDVPIVLFRDADSKPVALFDRCPHRFAPLSKGKVANGVVTCGYHGLAFAGSGACVGNPHGAITGALAVRSYPVHEAHSALWVWMSDPMRADPALIPDLSHLTGCPDSALSRGYLHSYGNYQLYVDNILDLSHTDYLHPTTLGGGATTRATAQVEQHANQVTVRWESFGERASPLVDSLLPIPGQPADLVMEVRWSPPGVMTLRTGAVPAGAPESAGIASHNVHVLTPETAATSHYFFAATRNFRLDDVALNESIAERRAWIFANEDKPMIEAQQRRMGEANFWSLKPALLKTDHAPVLVRRLMDRMIAAQIMSEENASLHPGVSPDPVRLP